ncbi:MAG: hypothetical protein ACTSYZ_06395 [Candidatus Helarchaeota archaeon]
MLDKKILEKRGKMNWEPMDNIIMDWVCSIGLYMAHFLSYSVYKPPQTLFLISVFTELGYIFLAFVTLLLPMVIFTIIEMIWAKKYKKDENYSIINTSIGLLPWLFIIGFPVDIFQLVAFIITILVVYVGVYERFPIIKMNIKFRRLYKSGYNSSKELFSYVETSTLALYTAEMVYILASSLKIYPVPFLILIEARYFIKKLVFPDRLLDLDAENEEDKEKYNKAFYRRWALWKNISTLLYSIPYICTIGVWIFFEILKIYY